MLLWAGLEVHQGDRRGLSLWMAYIKRWSCLTRSWESSLRFTCSLFLLDILNGVSKFRLPRLKHSVSILSSASQHTYLSLPQADGTARSPVQAPITSRGSQRKLKISLGTWSTISTVYCPGGPKAGPYCCCPCARQTGDSGCGQRRRCDCRACVVDEECIRLIKEKCVVYVATRTLFEALVASRGQGLAGKGLGKGSARVGQKHRGR